jgi:hypothetical protein
MLYVGCGSCRTIVPLWSAGQFYPHAPVPTMAVPQGCYCGMCGPRSPVFICTVCWTRQMLFLPGSAFMPPGVYPGSNYSVAPVVQAKPGASQKFILSLIKQAIGDFASEAGTEYPTIDFDQWTQGWDQSWPQGGDPSL